MNILYSSAVACLILAQNSFAGEIAPGDSLRFKIGQMIMSEFFGASPSEEIMADISGHNLGGVILYQYQNLPERAGIINMTTQLNDGTQLPLFIAVDQEPMIAQRLNSWNGFFDTPSAHELGSWDSEYLTRNVARTFASWFLETGININLAPVVDLRIQPYNVIGDRAFSIESEVVIRNAHWFIDEFRQAGLMTTLKHFPGHGSSLGDSHYGFTDVTDTWTETELEPYRALIDSGMVDIIMTAHVFNANIDSLHPATLSYPTITGLLRDNLGYNGLVVTDEMSMGAISANYGMEEAFVLAVKAGVDVLLYRIGSDPGGHTSIGYIVDLLEAKVLDGTIAAGRIDESYRRIMRLKDKYLLNQPVAAHQVLVNRMYIRPGMDSVAISAWIDNPDLHNLAVTALIHTDAGVPADTIALYNDGTHQDGAAGDSIWAALWVTAEEENYFISMMTKDQDAATSRTLPRAARLTSAGPVVYAGDSLALRPRPADPRYPQLYLTLANEGLVASVADITAALSTTDASIASISKAEASFGDLTAGATVTGTDFFQVEYTADASLFEPVTFTLSISSGGYEFWSDTITLRNILDIIASEVGLPVDFTLYQNYPNPFNPATTIAFDLPQAGPTSLIVYNLLGREVVRLADDNRSAGNYHFRWEARDNFGREVPAGIYIASLVTPEYTNAIKMLLLK
ncbi:glycoside hydrolase family 3 N-terminal domain-containing protein [Candidatus Neomarinimicrobiota bacterium]